MASRSRTPRGVMTTAAALLHWLSLTEVHDTTSEANLRESPASAEAPADAMSHSGPE
jgi:hypothetical protein